MALSEERGAVVVELWNAGKTYKAIADAIEGTEQAVRWFLKNNRGRCPKRERVFVTSDLIQGRIDEGSRLWLSGVSPTEIARQFGVSRTYILQLAHNNRAKFPHRGNRKKTIVEKAEKRIARIANGARRSASNGTGPKGEPIWEPRLSPFDIARQPDAKPLWELGSSECKWPVNNGRPFLFCGEAVSSTATNGRYCLHHTHVSKYGSDGFSVGAPFSILVTSDVMA